MDQLDSLVNAAKDVGSHPSPLPAQVVAGFLKQYPLDVLFRLLSGADPDARQLAIICSALSRILSARTDAPLSPADVAQYAEAALGSPHAQLRLLGCQQLGLVLAGGGGPPSAAGASASPMDVDVGAAAPHLQTAGRLAATMADTDTGVAQQAGSALRSWAASCPTALGQLLDPASPPGAQLAALAAGQDAVPRLRVLALLVGVAGHSAAAAAQLKASGIVDLLLAELSPPVEPLATLAALQLLQDLAATPEAGMAPLLAELAVPRLVALATDPLLAPGALALAAQLLAAAFADGGASGSGGGHVAVGALASAGEALAAALFERLDERGDAGPEEEASALDATLHLATSSGGAQLVAGSPTGLVRAVCERALGRAAANQGIRIAALHALASLAGLERAGQARARSAALLPPPCEAALRAGVYAAAAAGVGGALAPAGAFAALVEQPFVEVRVAAYRCLSALALRLWCAAEVANAAPLMSRLCDPRSETGQQASQWRHAAVMALWATCTDVLNASTTAASGVAAAPAMSVLPAGDGAAHMNGASNGASTASTEESMQEAALAAVVDAVRAAVAAGPYGTGGPASAVHHEFLVATLPRGGGA